MNTTEFANMSSFDITDTDGTAQNLETGNDTNTLKAAETAEILEASEASELITPPNFSTTLSDEFTSSTPTHKGSGKTGTLFLVSSHIGNPDDMSNRALKALKMADVVVGEEGKTVARLLHENKITKKLEELNEHNENQQTGVLLTMLQQGKTLALVSDAGTPLFADPGAQLVRRCIEKGIAVKAIPGASSIMTALVTSGLSMDSFLFAGFLSREPAERLQELKRLADEPRTVVLLETPYRLVPLLEAARQIMPSRRAYLGCNLTMDSETHHYGTISELYTKFVVMRFKGEFVFCFEGGKGSSKSASGKSSPEKSTRGDFRSEARSDSRFERGEQRFGERKFGEKKFGEKKFGEKKFGDSPRGERSSSDRKFSDRPRGEGRSEERGERKFGERKFGEKKFGEKKFGEKKFGDSPRGERSFSDRKFSDRPRGEGRSEERGERKFGERKFGERKFGEKKFGEKKFGEKKFGERPRGDRKFNDRPRGGDRPPRNKPDGGSSDSNAASE